MPTHKVKKGECLSKIAFAHGFADWRTVYDHAENAKFRQLRPNPNLIFPGDKIYIPDRAEPKYEEGGTEQKHRFRRRSSTLPIRIKVSRPWVEDLTNWYYQLTGRNFDFSGMVAADEVIEHELPIDTEEAWITLHPFKGEGEIFSWRLRISDLDPVTTTRGIQQRLNNLWFYAGAEDGIEGPRTRTAVRCFQRRYGLDVDGIPGPQTQAKLREVYGC